MDKTARYLSSLEDEILDEIEQRAMAILARLSDSAEGYGYFYQVVYGRRLPAHAKKWVEAIYEAEANGRGAVIEAFRGSTKTTTVTTGLAAFKIGHRPHTSNLLVQVGDEIAKDNAQHIADMIAYNPGWRMVFPHVVPDTKAGWGGSGYEVKRIDIGYNEWRRLCAVKRGKDATFVGLGYRSRAIIGKHPTGLLVMDDIHDENNTRSARELETTIKIVAGTILPTTRPETLTILIGTPWRRNDVLDYAKATGRFDVVRTAVRRDGEPTWPDVFDEAMIKKQRELSGEIEFGRMFMLDLEAAAGAHLKAEWLHSFPSEKIKTDWPVVMGVDYASTADEMVGSERDYFAAAIGRVLPGGAGVVLVDGFRGRVSQGEAEQRLKALAEIYGTTQLIGVEAVGKGEEFYHLLLRSSNLPIMPYQPGGRSKGQRFERGMAPLFQFNRAWVSDIETGFIKSFREEWLQWPFGEHDDTLDAVYWMLRAGLPHLFGRQGRRREKGRNPFTALGRG